MVLEQYFFVELILLQIYQVMKDRKSPFTVNNVSEISATKCQETPQREVAKVIQFQLMGKKLSQIVICRIEAAQV